MNKRDIKRRLWGVAYTILLDYGPPPEPVTDTKNRQRVLDRWEECWDEILAELERKAAGRRTE